MWFVFHKTQTIYDGKVHSLSIESEKIKAEAQEARFQSHLSKMIWLGLEYKLRPMHLKSAG